MDERRKVSLARRSNNRTGCADKLGPSFDITTLRLILVEHIYIRHVRCHKIARGGVYLCII